VLNKYTWHDSTSLSDRTPTTEQLKGLPRLTINLIRSLMQKSSLGTKDPFLNDPDALLREDSIIKLLEREVRHEVSE
jgi:hypothetical protein